MNKKIGIIGGDLRNAYLAELLSEEKTVYTYALEGTDIKNAIKCNTLEQLSMEAQTVIMPIPISKDKKYIYTPYSKEKLEIAITLQKLKSKKIILGAIDETVNKIAKENNINIFDILKQEEFAILNAIPTAEGAIEIAIKKSNITLNGSNCLVLGFGRIGKILTKMLNGIGANVYCEARKLSDIAQIMTYNYKAINLTELNKNLNKFDFIFNTIPYLILNKDNIKLLKKDCVIIDLASFPGGVDFEETKKHGIEASLELALPGKVAPKTCAKYIKDIIENII